MWWPAEKYITHFFGNSILVQNHWRKISNSGKYTEWWKMWQYKVIACKFTWHFSTWNTKFYRNFPLWWDASESASPLAPTPGENIWKECHRKHLKGTVNVLEPCTDSLSLSAALSLAQPLSLCASLSVLPSGNQHVHMISLSLLDREPSRCQGCTLFSSFIVSQRNRTGLVLS